jgi:hypothetical protein
MNRFRLSQGEGFFKRCFFEIQVVGCNHELFQVYHILDIVTQKGIKRVLIVVSDVILLEAHGKKAVNTGDVAPVNAQLPFAALEPAAVPKAF